MKGLLLLFLALIALIDLTLSQILDICPKERCQSTGQCVDNVSLCPVAISCPSPLIKPNQYTCSKVDKLIVSTVCPIGLKTCWDDTCVVSSSSCPSMTTCPSTEGVRCPDNSCVNSPLDCPNYLNCPPFIPVRCPNGDCRRNLRDCPGRIQCPSAFSILCNDGSCRMTSDECEMAAEDTQCADQTMTRCPDGTCTNSKFLCSTPKTCPIGFVMCWNGACAVNFGSCEAPDAGQSNTCSNKNSVLCALDWSCRPDISYCPTAVICPVDKPVRCWDFSCMEALSGCPVYQDCPEGSKKCMDGSCTSTSCGSHITCSMDAPFKCYDNTCRQNPSDCLIAPECSDKYPILCWDGTCVGNRGDCQPPDICPNTEPVKCPDNMCRKTADECKAITDCPTGFSRCLDGSCRRDMSDCEVPVCPINFPAQCDNGMCVSDKNYCDLANGCPFNAPFKCQNGRCVQNGLCLSSDVVLCKEGTQQCPDGSCLPISSPCPNQNGCSIDTPSLCADGTCIDPTKSTCAIPICPSETPIKCPNGLCVVSISACSSTFDIAASLIIGCSGLISCSDGTCAHNPEECKPVFSCPVSYERCDDGSCRVSADYCPESITCPTNKPVRCDDGSCALDLTSCLNISGCPLTTPNKCSNSGLCTIDQSKCNVYDLLFAKANGCSQNLYLKCPSGQCVADIEKCGEATCSGSTPVYCPNSGTCAANMRACMLLGEECPDGYLRCPDKLCQKTYSECRNIADCPLTLPFRCVDGSCQRYPTLFNNNSTVDSQGCDIGIQCPDYKPYICADGSCSEKSSFCLSLYSCPDGFTRCFDRTCAASPELCDQPRRKCPARNPILCENGNCVDNIFGCVDDTCTSGDKPHKCFNGNCVASYRQCVTNEYSLDTLCHSDEFTCKDGSCRRSLDQCPLFKGCTDTKYPYKCQDGSCASIQENCAQLLSQNSTSICTGNNTMLCEDGICRGKCPDYNGCPNLKPLLCPMGSCVNTPSECAGQSNCPLDTPFRCFDGSCIADYLLCPRTKRGFVGTNVNIFIYPGLQVSADLIIGEDNNIIGQITIPSNTFYTNILNPSNNASNNASNNSTNNTTNNSTNNSTNNASNNSAFNITNSRPTNAILTVKSVTTSRIQNLIAKYNETRQDDVMKTFPYADSLNNFSLEYQYSILSPVIEISLNDNSINFKTKVILMLAYDFPSISAGVNNGLNIPLSAMDDVCLGWLNPITHQWEGYSSDIVVSSTNNLQLWGGVNKTGVYAVILCPTPDETKIISVQNLLVRYFVIILISSAVVALVLFVGFYMFFRIYRYRHKYKESREESKKYEDKMQEMTQLGTTHIGQTLGDNLENIIYTNNPSYKIIKLEGKNHREEELNNLHESMNKRFKVLEKNSEQLKSTFTNVITELDRLKEYQGQLSTSKKIIKTEEDLDL